MKERVAQVWNSRPLRKLRRDRWAMVCLMVIAAYSLVALFDNSLVGEVRINAAFKVQCQQFK